MVLYIIILIKKIKNSDDGYKKNMPLVYSRRTVTDMPYYNVSICFIDSIKEMSVRGGVNKFEIHWEVELIVSCDLSLKYISNQLHPHH